MKRVLPLCAVLCMLLALATGCAAGGESPKPTATPFEAPKAPSVSPKGEAGQAAVLIPVGKKAELIVGTKKVAGNAYYAGEGEDSIVLPLTEVAKALGWAVVEPTTTGPIEVKMTKQGMEDVLIQYTKPETEVLASVEELTATKGGKSIDIEDDPRPFVDGKLHVTKAFIDKTLEEISMEIDGETKVTIEPKQ